MARTHAEKGVTYDAYNIGLVASAASYVYLNAQHRYSNARGVFLFHAATLTANVPLPAERLREAAAKLESYERVVRATMKARTRLTDSETAIYVRRTVVLNADDAKRDGVVDAIEEFRAPPEISVGTIGVRVTPTAARPATPQPPN